MAAGLVAWEAFAASIAAGAFAATAVRVRQRSPAGDDETALDLFSLWWVGLACYALAQAGLDLAAIVQAPLTVALFLRVAQVMSFCVGLWGLMFYVAFVLTGRRTLLAPLAILFSFYYGVVLFAFTLGHPVALEVRALGAEFTEASPLVPPAALTALFLVPPLIAAATYAALFFFTQHETARVRVLAAGTGTVAWLASLLLRMSTPPDWRAGVPILALVGALVVMSAFAPQKWLGGAG